MTEVNKGSEQRIPDYDLRLPPQAPAQPGDEDSVRLLAESEIRDALEGVSRKITDHYRELETSGKVVEEVLRGATGKGVGFAVAKVRATSEAAEDDERPVVFAFMLDELLTPEGKRLAETPRELVELPGIRGGSRIGIAVQGGTAILEFPFGEKPHFQGEEVIDFREAAFGKRRVQAANSSVEWVLGVLRQERKAWDKARSEGNSEGMASVEGRMNEIDNYRHTLLDRVYEHPEWIDAPEPVLPGYEDYLSNHPGLNGRGARHLVERYIEVNHILDPVELDAINRALMPENPIVEPPERPADPLNPGDAYNTAYQAYADSYYKRYEDLARGKGGVLDRAVDRVRRANLEAAVGEGV